MFIIKAKELIDAQADACASLGECIYKLWPILKRAISNIKGL
jgi:hypothetical protein